jgi:hypothetical protein
VHKIGFGGAGGKYASMTMLSSVVPTATGKVEPMVTMADSVSGLRRCIGWVPVGLSDSELKQLHSFFVRTGELMPSATSVDGLVKRMNVVVCVSEVVVLDGFCRVGKFGRKVWGDWISTRGSRHTEALSELRKDCSQGTLAR